MSIREALRQGSRTLHEQVDGAFGGFDLARCDGYGAFLVAHARALAPLEAHLQEHDAAGLLSDWSQRRRMPALLDDLATLGIAPPAPLAVSLAPTRGALWGMLYVLEGSRMGARFLSRQVRDAGHSPEALRYLEHPGGAGWPAFLQALEVGAAAEPETEVITGVEQAFACFLRAASSAVQPA